ncbi:ADP-ribosylglycohydrolase family protein [Paenibacillus radicis (ex Xue et al. 2023)]|uniref:ADP-ribosylglycohydrolase family protein n=1 Tax=Paenibacillus radicis (ex Xue et al. 2023) TaxID=2972489 RepID=A0ABT1YV80_9BACL|nr:ADP-ribosylglycohydrolase family protein [Paenibacillus radicis (ex Xue et al. 2023)]MCR8636843.1 ADP-ribosylglycohydrolase family protein [Paenibacillus radicis (ex Xue et al. 2023)]
MGISKLNEKEYYRKIYGGWLGKNIGGTLGYPVEGKMELLDLTYYPELSEGPLPNDDLDLQIVWLHALEQYGARLTAAELGQEWMEHVFFPFDEYGYGLANLRRGLIPPVAGWFNNPFADCMGSPIRSEIWAMIAPGCPGVAAYYAYQDAIVDHAGGEGVYGEMFFAAIESAAFFESDRDRLIQIGLTYIPEECRTARAVNALLGWHKEGRTWTEARELILEHHGHPNFTDAPQNIAFTLLGWLYGEDFGDAILKAVNCGYDTDCTGATLGAILGIILGPEKLPERWLKPVGDRIAVNAPIKGFPIPETLDQLTSRTLNIGKEVAAVWNIPVEFGQEKSTTELQPELLEFYDPRWLWKYSFQSNRYLLPKGTKNNIGLELIIDYGNQGPSIGKRQSKDIAVTLINRSMEAWEGWLKLAVPEGWRGLTEEKLDLKPNQEMSWTLQVTANEEMKAYYPLQLEVVRCHDNQFWNSETVPFYLVSATHWKLSGPDNDEWQEVIIPGNRIDFAEALQTSEAGLYRASTTLHNPESKQIRLITATASPVKAYLNGKLIINDDSETDCMPAFHRALPSKLAEIKLPAGEHLLEIEAVKGDGPLELYVLPAAVKNTKTPGPFYFYTDVLFT